jgi:transcription termination/antitermination protein NusA
MNPSDMLRIVDSLHREKNIDKELVMQAIEAALVTAAKKHYGETAEITVAIDRESGALSGTHNGEPMDSAEISGRIGAQTAKQVIIQKIREAERDSLLGEYGEQIGQLVNGVITRSEGGATIVSLGTVEAILPRSEQIPGETHHPNERVRAVVFEVRPQGSRVKVVLSRTRPVFVQRLFEQEIPEISDGVISVNAIAREPGHRSKVAVSSTDQRVDCVGACVGVRGNRIKNIVDELGGERIDIVRFNEDPETLIRAALQPAEVDQVLLCDMIGRAIVLVREDQLSLAIGRKGQNVRLASKLCGWDIEIMTNEELEEQIDRAVAGFSQIEGMTEELAQRLVEQGYLSYDDLSVIEPDALMEMGGLTEEQVDTITNQAEDLAAQAEQAADDEKRRKKEEENRAAMAAVQAAAHAAANPASAVVETAPTDEPAAEGMPETAAEVPAANESPAPASESPAAESPAPEESPS